MPHTYNRPTVDKWMGDAERQARALHGSGVPTFQVAHVCLLVVVSLVAVVVWALLDIADAIREAPDRS